jgi:hypothetical protein
MCVRLCVCESLCSRVGVGYDMRTRHMRIFRIKINIKINRCVCV